MASQNGTAAAYPATGNSSASFSPVAAAYGMVSFLSFLGCSVSQFLWHNTVNINMFESLLCPL
jgi:hypothetical protein